MVKIKTALLGLDFVFLSISGYSLLEIIETLSRGTFAMEELDSLLKLLLSIAGFVYLCVRIYNSYTMERLNRDFRKQEIIQKRIENESKSDFD